MTNNSPQIIGVVSDTHIPDRVTSLHPLLLSSLRQHGVQTIFHAGDISSSAVLKALQEIASVVAVRGNRDWLLRGSLPTLYESNIFGVRIALLHGHINFTEYLKDKLYHITRGYNLNHYLPRLLAACPKAQVIVFGHTHQPVSIRVQNYLLFNPGSCTTKSLVSKDPHYGILTIHPDGRIKTELFTLVGYRIKNRNWIREELS